MLDLGPQEYNHRYPKSIMVPVSFEGLDIEQVT